MAKSLTCRLALHSWRRERNDDGEGYRVCRRCGKVDDPGGRGPTTPF